MSLRAVFDRLWQRLTVRERTYTKLAAVGLAAVFIVALVVEPAARARAKRSLSVPQLAGQAVAVEALAAEAATLKTAAPTSLPPLAARINGSLKAQVPTGATLTLLPTGNVQIAGESVDANALVAWLMQATRSERLRVQSAEIDRLGAGQVRARIEMAPA